MANANANSVPTVKEVERVIVFELIGSDGTSLGRHTKLTAGDAAKNPNAIRGKKVHTNKAGEITGESYAFYLPEVAG